MKAESFMNGEAFELYPFADMNCYIQSHVRAFIAHELFIIMSFVLALAFLAALQLQRDLLANIVAQKTVMSNGKGISPTHTNSTSAKTVAQNAAIKPKS